MTEDEAKTKWCPHVRVGDKAVNRYFDGFPSHSYCIGSECMAWRWIKPVYTGDAKNKYGFCGLAGKP